jgi:two-component system, OmpR family, phosphate regulon response regulator PhoB
MADTARPERRVLVVEDDDSIALALEYLVTRAGHGHARIADGAEALPFIRATRPDLVLLDVMLPGVSGFDICQGVRGDPTLAGVKILMMTARGSAVERRRGMELGADGFVTKPFDVRELRDEVNKLIGTPL